MKLNKRILVVSPHPDDETLGVGGTIAKYSSMGYEVFVLTISGHLPPFYSQEDYDKTVSESHLVFKRLGVSDSAFLEIPATTIGDIALHEFNSMISKELTALKTEKCGL